jgi:hypothetical protein
MENDNSATAAAVPFDPAVLLALAERCEREEVGQDMDDAIGVALGVGWLQFKPWTTSLDAAVTLVPEGDDVFWQLGHDGAGPDPSLFLARVLVCSQPRPVNGHIARSESPTLALCAAALRARAAMVKP